MHYRNSLETNTNNIESSSMNAGEGSADIITTTITTNNGNSDNEER